MTLPRIRHGVAGLADPRIDRALALASADGLDHAGASLLSLVDYEGQLWATWRDANYRSRFAPLLTRAWAKAGGERGMLHLIPSAEDYDYQEDCMNDAG
ncbi:hypothetical protein ABC347_06170 [Sphingomonas sp. 1P06PA]|uniref:hypothetical protein n=1 Tax=Sphingomonas sp. 1P06PA TaxID=554121 RepID=UPI0039A568BE